MDITCVILSSHWNDGCYHIAVTVIAISPIKLIPWYVFADRKYPFLMLISAIFITDFSVHSFYPLAVFFSFLSSTSSKCRNMISMTLNTRKWWQFFFLKKSRHKIGWKAEKISVQPSKSNEFPELINNLCKVFTKSKKKIAHHTNFSFSTRISLQWNQIH